MRGFIVLLILCILITGCSSSKQVEVKSKSILYDFREPFSFPFEVNEVRSEIAIDNPEYLQQFVFHYKNKQTLQEIKYILSKVIDKPEELPKQSKQLLELKSGKQAYYQEDMTSQSIWWEGQNGFLARFVYYIDGNREQLGSNKLAQSDFIGLVNQVQQ
ncbi:hypothetical protein [Paenibacillus qinlingensis]|uniref:Lipoprotein n=1 Tax=Paenibacillus qinlingensis TaxID=1837343 RepID=A0ABU1NWM7_9BACL|nr:hypothetical protein [Paenibacillus qinlingensis]MDR6551883.1 hypothetical protein [Paenibacillus qinlingensis]